jgi:hypothetical protein
MNQYLAERLDGARDLYLLALALGERGDGQKDFGSLIREARIHFISVIEEARLAGLDIRAIQDMLATHTVELMDTVRPDLRERLEELMRSRSHPR